MQQTKPQKPTALTPSDPLGARFCRYFNHPWKHIYAPVPEPGAKPQWLASKYCLSPRTLWQRYLDPDTLIGLRFGDETRYCLLDIDKGSPNHPANNFSGFKDFLNALEEIGLTRPLVLKSSSSGGLHVHYFFDRPLPTFALACAIKFALQDAGFRLQSGCLESFPNTKAWGSHYNACRLPLQVGSWLLDDDLQPLTDDLTHFLDAADVAAANQDLTTLQACCTVASERYEPRRISGTSIDHEEWKREWEKEIALGWTAPGQTNELLQKMVAYGKVWLELSGEDLIDYVVNTAINATGYQEFCGHQHEIRRRAQEWVTSTEKNNFYSPYRSYPKRSGTYKETFGYDATNNVVPLKSRVNSQRSAEAQDRVRQAFAHLKVLGTLPSSVAARAKALIATAKEILGIGVSRVTLWKYLKLWHPKHYKDAAVLQEQPAPCNDCSEIPTPPFCSAETDVETKSPEPAPCNDCSENSYTPPLMKVIPELSGMAPPQRVPCPALDLKRGEFEGGNEPVAAVEPEEAAEPAINTADLRRITALRLQAAKHAQQSVRSQSFELGRLIRGTERENAEQIAKFRFYWESAESVLMAEATEWAISNPTALPEALPPAAASPKNAESLPVVGDRVWWDDCPGHCSWMNPFTITAIDGGMAWLDFYSGLVPISKLRRGK